MLTQGEMLEPRQRQHPNGVFARADDGLAVKVKRGVENGATSSAPLEGANDLVVVGIGGASNDLWANGVVLGMCRSHYFPVCFLFDPRCKRHEGIIGPFQRLEVAT